MNISGVPRGARRRRPADQQASEVIHRAGCRRVDVATRSSGEIPECTGAPIVPPGSRRKASHIHPRRRIQISRRRRAKFIEDADEKLADYLSASTRRPVRADARGSARSWLLPPRLTLKNGRKYCFRLSNTVGATELPDEAPDIMHGMMIAGEPFREESTPA